MPKLGFIPAFEMKSNDSFIDYKHSMYIFLNAWYLTLTKGYSPKVKRVKNVKKVKITAELFQIKLYLQGNMIINF